MRRVLWMLAVLVLLLLAAPAHATDPDDSVPLVGVQSGPLEAGGDIWFFTWGTPKSQALGITLNYFPAERIYEPRVTFEVWVSENGPHGPMLVQVGQGTPSGQPLGTKYWRGTGGSSRRYFVHLVNKSPYGIDYALSVTGTAYPPPRLQFAPTPLIQEFEKREAARLTRALTWRGQDTFVIRGSIIIYTDPYKLQSYEPKADLVLITHEHADHCSPEDIAKIVKPGTTIVTTVPCYEKLGRIYDTMLAQPGDKLMAQGVPIEVVPAYNTNKFRSPGVLFHPREAGMVGYVFTVDGIRYYLAGDTDAIPEMEGIAPHVALVPVGGRTVMTPEEAIEALQMIRPRLAVPMHYGTNAGTIEDARRFQAGAIVMVAILEQQP